MGHKKWMAVVAILGFSVAAQAQQQPQTQAQQNQSIYHVTLVGKTITSVSYQHRSGSTMIDFRGTPLLPLAKGAAKVDSKQGSIVVSANFKNLQPAQVFGKEYLTYVLWAITPEGKPSNLGEIVINGTKSSLTATTNLQSFGMIVTAEPYFAVNVPSDVVVLENVLRADTVGTSEQVSANYELLKRGQYTYDMSKMREPITTINPKVPLELYEARNAVAIAQSAGADTLAPDAYQKSVSSLANAESLMSRKANKKDVIAAARDAVQTAADARQIAVQRAAQNERDAERAAQQAATDAAQAKQRQDEAARPAGRNAEAAGGTRRGAAGSGSRAGRCGSVAVGSGSEGSSTASDGGAERGGESRSGQAGFARGVARSVQPHSADHRYSARFAGEYGGRVVRVRQV